MLLNNFYKIFLCFNSVVIILGGLLTWRMTINQRRYALFGLFLTFFFMVMDVSLLLGLRLLQLSFGSIGFTVMVITTFRLVLFFLWLFNCQVSLWPRRKMLVDRDLQRAGLVCIGMNVFIILLVIYAFYVEPFMLTTSFINIETQKFHPGSHLRLVQISDLHVERLTRREENLVQQVNALHPDVIVFTGDFPNLSNIDDPLTWKQISQVVSGLAAPYGIYLVNGSNENPERVKQLSRESGTVALENTIQSFNWVGGNISLVGVNMARDPALSLSNFNTTIQGMDPDVYTILLFHTPDLIKAAASSHVDLYLAGHTHGGQIRLPFYGAIVTSSAFFKDYEMGLYQVGSTKLYVSRGIGMEGLDAPRARFLASPEIVVIDLIGK